ncbi:tail fiber domain-containing protein [Pendulispora albinea]|uniref:Tail fiber domain-containing protein n=1 Tax=Pendulispora albinea TaxID=2741071 RepID=A0ABZ2M237_9BACT
MMTMSDIWGETLDYGESMGETLDDEDEPSETLGESLDHGTAGETLDDDMARADGGLAPDERPRYPSPTPGATPSVQGIASTGQVVTPGNPSRYQAPRPGTDKRDLKYIYNPDAYQYGGKAGLAESEAARYGGYAQEARTQRGAFAEQYGQAMQQAQQARAQQMQGLQYLQNQIAGTGPSVAQQQMLQGLTAAQQQQASIAASARGGGANLAAAQAASANAAAGLQQNAVQQGALLRAQEQLAAMGQYGQLAGALRGGDYQAAQLQAAQQEAAAGQQSEYERMQQQLYTMQHGLMQAGEEQNLTREAAERGWTLANRQQSHEETKTWLGTAASVAGSVLGALIKSDARAKKEIRTADAEIDDALSRMRPYSFQYKEGHGDAGPQIGILAQELERSRAGRRVVVHEPGSGLRMLSVPKATGFTLAAVARLGERISELEKGTKHARK